MNTDQVDNAKVKRCIVIEGENWNTFLRMMDEVRYNRNGYYNTDLGKSR